MANNRVRDVVLREFRKKESMQSIGEDENFFEAGVSSLTIVELQIKVEEQLGLTVPTSELMRLSTMRGWIDAYNAREAVSITD